MIASGHSPQHLWVSDINPDTLKTLAENLNVNTSASKWWDIYAVECHCTGRQPQVLSSVAKKRCRLIQQKKSLVVSIAAGIMPAKPKPVVRIADTPLFVVCPTRPRWYWPGLRHSRHTKGNSWTTQPLRNIMRSRVLHFGLKMKAS